MRNAEQDREANRLLAEYDRVVARLMVLGIDVVKLRALDTPGDEWCPVCHRYHVDPGEKTDAGRLTRPCPLLPPGVGANHPINARFT